MRSRGGSWSSAETTPAHGERRTTASTRASGSPTPTREATITRSSTASPAIVTCSRRGPGCPAGSGRPSRAQIASIADDVHGPARMMCTGAARTTSHGRGGRRARARRGRRRTGRRGPVGGPRNLAQPDVRRSVRPQTRRSKARPGVATTTGSLRTRSDRPPALRHPGFALKDRTVGQAEHRTPPALTAHFGSADIPRIGPEFVSTDMRECSRGHIVSTRPARVRVRMLAAPYHGCNTSAGANIRATISWVQNQRGCRYSCGHIVGAGPVRVRLRPCRPHRPSAQAWVPEGRRWP